MKQTQITELARLLPASYENIFNVYKDTNNMYFYNLLQTISIPELPPSYYMVYSVKPKDTWPLISYKAYGTTILWWLILHANNIINPLVQPQRGMTLRVLTSEYVGLIVGAIN